tara:strand:+ start:55 stop:558 length:504 start_codon:yes stop_codon:yes gene_type:complete
MEQGLVLQSLHRQFPWKPWMIVYFTLLLAIYLYVVFGLGYGWDASTPNNRSGSRFWMLQMWWTIPNLCAFFVAQYRHKLMKKCVMLEAMGSYREAMTIAAKFATPQLITSFSQRYASQLAQEEKTLPADIKNTTQSSPVFNIHNIQNQQGPTEINVQDSVVTDWNQR